MIIKVSSNLLVENPTPEIREWCNSYLVISNPEYMKKARMNLWLGDTPKKIWLYEQNSKNLILPYGILRDIPKEITDTACFVSCFKNHRSIDYKANVNLYDYQERAVEALIKAKYGILQSPAGSGKTQIGIALAAKLSKKTLWLCHTLDLVKQSKERAEMYIDKDLIGTITEGKVQIGKAITFATIQTLSKLDLPLYKDEWDCIITDEVHRVAGSPGAITQYQKILNNLSARHKYGLSATVHRSDGLIEATFSLVGNVVYKIEQNEVSEKIMRVGIVPVSTNVGMDKKALNSDGTINYSKLISYLCEDDYRNNVIIKNIENKSSLILSERLEHLNVLMSMLPDDLRKDAVMISGKMSTKKGKQDRAQAIEDMRSGKKKFLFATYALAKEGLDIPRLERLYLTTPQKDYAVITQSIGRIARICDDKDEPKCYDFVDNIGYLIKNYKLRCKTYRTLNCYFSDKVLIC